MRNVGARLLSPLVVVSVVCAGGLAASTQTPPGQTAPSAQTTAEMFPEGTGKAALLRVCSNCHGADTVVQTLRTRQEWSDVVDQMSRFGAEANDSEFTQILDYLVKFYSPIRVNKATAKELENVLDVSASVAEAIVTYRQDKGPFKAIDDLKLVPGLEPEKIDARKARLTFGG
jgi:competence ComEA-like helix-hairpin-helix protein